MFLYIFNIVIFKNYFIYSELNLSLVKPIAGNNNNLNSFKEALTSKKLFELEVVIATTWCTALGSEV
jgi:hypothetical protein